MAIRSIRTMGDEVLTKECKPVKEMTEHTAELIEDMFETMYEANGVGLAAPQVGIRKQIVVIDVDDGNQYVLINPEIVETEGSQTGSEGCLSVPGKTGVVTRPEKESLIRSISEEGLRQHWRQSNFLSFWIRYRSRFHLSICRSLRSKREDRTALQEKSWK